MKNILVLIFYFLVFTGNSQHLQLKLIDSIPVQKNKFENFIGVDTHNFLFFLKNEILIKTDGIDKWVYTNYELGIPTSVSILNPLQILVFYYETNTLVFLDRFLNETQRIDLNTISPSKIALWAENTKNQEVWLHNEITNRLEFFNYKTNITESQTIPFSKKPIHLSANFNFAFVLFENELNSYNIYGTQVNSIFHNDLKTISIADNFVIGNTSTNKLIFYDLALKQIGSSSVLKNNWQDFSVRNEKLYIYNTRYIYIYQLILSSK